MNPDQTPTKNILDSLNPVYFWDVNRETLDPVVSKRLIIERVFSRGSIEEMTEVTAYYSRQVTMDVLKKVNYLDPKTLNFVSVIFNIPKSEFKCYKRRLSNPPHWDY